MKVKKLNELRIECDMPSHISRYRGDLEQQAKDCEMWAREFMAFVRDHRSQDPVYLSVHKVYADVCSHCHSEWEEDADGPLCCQKALNEHEASKAAA